MTDEDPPWLQRLEHVGARLQRAAGVAFALPLAGWGLFVAAGWLTDPVLSAESLAAVGLLRSLPLLLGVGMLAHEPLRERVLGAVAWVVGYGV